MPYYPHRWVEVPAPEAQTELRKSWGFWIGSLVQPSSDEPRWATWLLRSPHNPANPHWRGVQVDAPAGTMPSTEVVWAASRALNILPRFVDNVAVLQPGDLSGVRHTTFVHTFNGQAIRPAVLPQPVPGVELGLFALDDLPEDMDPGNREWLGRILPEAIKQGMSSHASRIVAKPVVNHETGEVLPGQYQVGMLLNQPSFDEPPPAYRPS